MTLWADLLLILLNTLNLVSALLLLSSAPTLFSAVSVGLNILLIGLLLLSMLLFLRGKRLAATWITLFVIQASMLFATLAYSGIAVFAILIQAALTLLLIMTLLPQSQSSSAVFLLLGVGALNILLDAYWPFTRSAVDPLVQAGGILALVLAVLAFLVVILTRFKDISLYLKLLLIFTVIAIVPAAFVGTAAVRTLDQSLRSQADQTLANSASLTSESVDNFINGELSNIRIDAQSPVFVNYLLSQDAAENADPQVIENAVAAIAALRRKDPIFVISYGLLDITGQNVLDSQPVNIGANEFQFSYFSTPVETGSPFASSVIIYPTDRVPSIFFSAPVRDPQGRIIGILRVRYDLAYLQQLINRQNERAGVDSFPLLIDEKNIVIANGWDPYQVFVSITPLNQATLLGLQTTYRMPAGSPEALSVSIPGLDQYLAAGASNFQIREPRIGRVGNMNSQDQSAATTRLTSQDWRVVYFQPQASYLNAINAQKQNTTLIIVAAIFAALLAGQGFTSLLTTPIRRLATVATSIEAGDLSVQARVDSTDEIGALASTFNSMTGRLRDLVGSLEQRVQERTRDLERRAVQMEAAADVGSAAARLRNVDELLRQTTRLISQRFNYYHVGIFLLDARGEFAVLRASNSEGGQKMLGRGHQLKVGQVGIVGNVTSTGQPRIALDVGQDATFFDNPDLPNTRSEMALPLIVGGKILGALDVQSTVASAFGPEDITTLRVLADQIAIALENARLFEESQNAIESVRRAYGEFSRTGWSRVLQERLAETGYLSLAEDTVIAASGSASEEAKRAFRSGAPVLSPDRKNVHVPVKVRDVPIGVIRLERPDESPVWTDEDISMAEDLVEQLGTALESARLYNDISQRAERETLIAEILSRVNASIHLETILQTTVEELGRAIEDTDITLQIGAPGERK